MKALPFPVRIAAGLLAIALEQARDRPRAVIELPVTAVSQALQVPMRVHQKLSELAIKGDRLLGTLRPVEEKPTWAVSDEDEPPLRNGASPSTELRPVSPATTVPFDEPCVDVPEADAVLGDVPPMVPGVEQVRADAVTGELAAGEVCAEASATPVDVPEADAVLGDVPPMVPGVEQVRADAVTGELAAGEVAAEASATPVDVPEADAVLGSVPPMVPGVEQVRASAVTDELAAEEVIAKASAQPINPAEPPALSGYAEMSIAQLRDKLPFLELDELQALLAWEMAHGERPPFVTILTNRITIVTQE